MNKEAIIEMIKEGLRIAFFAALAALVAYASEKLGHMDPTSVQVVIGTVVLRLIDKFIHENKDIRLGGISPV